MTVVPQGGYTERVPTIRAPVVRKRLLEARQVLGWSRRKAGRAVASEMGEPPQLTVNHVTVSRYDGSSSEERASPDPPIVYVTAFAEATWKHDADRCESLVESLPPDWMDRSPRENWTSWLLAEDQLAFDLEALREQWDKIKERRTGAFPEQARTDDARARDRLRNAVMWVLLSSSGLPHPQDWRIGRDPLAWYLDDLARLFWEALWDRDLGPQALLERAWDLGRLLPQPNRLPEEGFLRVHELNPSQFRRWWALQSEALRVLKRPHPKGAGFRPDDMNLGHLGDDGYPIPWAEWVTQTMKILDRDEAVRFAYEEVLSRVSPDTEWGPYQLSPGADRPGPNAEAAGTDPNENVVVSGADGTETPDGTTAEDRTQENDDAEAT